MLQSKILVWELRGAVDCAGSCAITLYEITSLDHEIFDLQSIVSHRTCISP
jgi:hypothetical protein